MKEEINNNLSPREQRKVDDLTWELQFRKDAAKAIRENDSIQNYLSQYADDSVKNFIDHYVNQKVQLARYGQFYNKQFNEHELKWVDLATEHLSYIQQKKLFDMQCLWRAGQLELPEIEITYDFWYWEANIFNCPFLDPVTAEDVALYQEYLTGLNADLEDPLLHSFSGWQRYDDIKNAFDNDEDESRCNFPEWYDFYNGRKGAGILLALPDIKGEKESFYRSLGINNQEGQLRQKAAQEIKEIFTNPDKERISPDGRVHLQYYKPEFMDWFVETFEDKQTREYYRSYKWYNRHEEDNNDIDEAIDLLKEAEEYVAIEGYFDWMEAVKRAAHNFKAKKISEAIQPAYEQYMLNISMGIKFPLKESPVTATRETIKKEIMAGRVANGEPEDLNY